MGTGPVALKMSPRRIPWVRRGADHAFLLAMSALTFALVLAGFVPGLVRTAGRRAPITPLFSLHAGIFFAWLVLFLVQVSLVTRRRTQLHRQVGRAATVLILAILVVGYATAIDSGRRGFDLSGDLRLEADPLGLLVFPLGDLASFALLVGLGLWYRRVPEHHKRFMLMATTGSMMGAPIAHLVGHNWPASPALVPALLGLVLFTPAVYDRVRHGRFHPVTAWAALGLFAWGNIRAAVIAPNATWQSFAAWLVN